MKKRYNCSNNGRIPYSVREAAIALHVSLQTAHTFEVLQGRGFIVCTRKGVFSLKTSRASEWRLTELSNDTPSEHATKDFMRWQPPEVDPPAPRISRSQLLTRKRTLPPEKPNGSRSGSARAKNAPIGSRRGSANGQKRAPELPPQQHSAEGGERSAPAGSAVASEPAGDGVSHDVPGTSQDLADRPAAAAPASSPVDWQTLGYPAGAPTGDELLAALELRARERALERPRRRAPVAVHKWTSR